VTSSQQWVRRTCLVRLRRRMFQSQVWLDCSLYTRV